MKSIVFSDKSWHYWVARFADSYEDRDLSDICGYTRAFFAGLFWLSVCCVAAILATYAVGDLLSWIIAGLLHGFIFPNFIALMLLGLMGTLLIIVGVVGLIFLIKEITAQPSVTDSFIVQGYKSWKEKWCAKVVITSDGNQND